MDALYTDALVERFGYSIEFAGRVSSMQFTLSAAGAPLLGIFLDKRGKLSVAFCLTPEFRAVSLRQLSSSLPASLHSLLLPLHSED